MSKPETNIVSVPLANAYLNLNQEKDSVRAYDGFNKLNAPFYGGNLTPLWRKFLGASGNSSWIDAEQNVYKIENGVFTVTDKFGTTTILKNDFQEKTCTEVVKDNRSYKWFYDDDNYISITGDSSFELVLNGLSIATLTDFEDIFFNNGRAFVVSSGYATVYYNGEMLERIIERNGSKDWYVKPSYTINNERMVIAYSDRYYIFSAEGVFTEANVLYKTNDIVITYPKTDYFTGSGHGTLEKTINDVTYVGSDLDFNFQRGTFNVSSPTDFFAIKSKAKFYFHKKKSGVITAPEDYLKERDEYKGQAILNPSNNNVFYEVPVLNVYFDVSGIWGSNDSLSTLPAPTLFYKSLQNSFFIKKAELNTRSDTVIEITLTITEKKLYSRQFSKISYYPRSVETSSANILAFLFKYYENMFISCGSVSQNSETELQEVSGNYICAVNLDMTTESFMPFQYAIIDEEPYFEDTLSVDYPTSIFSCTQNYNNAYHSNFTDIITREDYNIVTTRGFALNISDNFRLLFNNGQIQAFSMFNNPDNLGTLVSAWINVDIEYFYPTEDGLIYVDSINKAHILTVRNFSDVNTLNCLISRYIIFNAIGMNCYDVLSGTWSRVGMDWNNRFVVSDNISSETPYYMTSAIFRTTDNTPSLSMLFNTDYLNQVTIGAMQPQFANDAIIQIYGATSEGESVLYRGSYVRSNEEWTLFTESAYSGTIAETQTDLNLLIPVNLFTNYETSYLNDIYAVIYNGFVPLYKSDNTASIIKFNYYLGNITSDMYLDALFILQGQYYRLSNKIIYAYSYSGGQLVDTQEVCNIGSLSFVGSSPSEAFFWSYANRTLYKFTGARTVESVMCADSIKAIYASLYDTTTSSLYISTDRGLVVWNDFGNFIIDDIKMATELTSTKLGITYKDKNRNLYGLYYNAVDGEEVIPVTLETAFYGTSDVQNAINDTLFLKIFNKDKLAKGVIKFGGYIQQNYGETKELVSKTVEVTAEQFDKLTDNLLLRYQPDKQRGIGISWKIESDFPISFIGIGASQTTELNMPKGNNQLMTSQKYNF